MVRSGKPGFSRIKNPVRQREGKDFEFNIFALLVMLILLPLGWSVNLALVGEMPEALLIRGFLAVAMAAALYAVYTSWNVLIIVVILAEAALFSATNLSGPWEMLSWQFSPAYLPFLFFVLFACILGPSFQVVSQWDKVVVLRFGRFRKVFGPGVFFLAPLADRCAAFVDTRIRVTDFSAEKVLTRDTVPIHVDALSFWMIWDAQKAVLEVENFLEAVTLSAQTALRDSIGKYSLTTLLSERETLYHEIRSLLDAKTNPWGITILSVEFTDILLPKDLEDVMSRQAQAEREKHARLLLGDAEIEVAEKFRKAADSYRDDPVALNLRAMNMVYEGMKARGSLVLLPSGALEHMNMGSVLGITGLSRTVLPDEAGETGNRTDASVGGTEPSVGGGEAAGPAETGSTRGSGHGREP